MYNQVIKRDVYKCLRCGECSEVCPIDCFDICSGPEEDDFSDCGACGQCVDACPTDAIETE